jgi:hypothetical protein
MSDSERKAEMHPNNRRRPYRPPKVESARAGMRGAVACVKTAGTACELDPGFDPSFVS